jgi:hypothetical protein
VSNEEALMPAGTPAVRKPPVRKHLMTPGAPRPQNREPMSLGRVQKWVLSTLAAVTILHMSAGLVIAAAYADRQSAQIGLLIIAGAFGVMAVGAALAIHQQRLVSAWYLLGLVPSLVGAWIIWG